MSQGALHARIRGRVQGVGFRWHSQWQAERLGLRGWVRNLSDGDVELWAEGDEEALAAMERWLAHGPPAARVERLTVSQVAALGYSEFTQRADA
ncbi:MAG: acylphosphatase [Gammaproteobacteria bacterium]|nr:acylphosphatase [Gammaproteobacteria bacterium]